MQEVSGSIPLTSTNLIEFTMHLLGTLITWVGLIVSVAGVVTGFWQLVHASESAMFWLSLVPMGFVGLLLGVTLTQLHGKR